MVASSEPVDTGVMSLKFFTSCFQKRPDRTAVKRTLSQDARATDDTESGGGGGGSSSQSRHVPRSLPQPVKHQTKPPVSHAGAKPAPGQPVSLSKKDAEMAKSRSSKSIVNSIIKPKPKYFNSNASTQSRSADLEPTLNKMFDQLLSDEDREADANTIGVGSIQAYTELLKVDMNSYEFFVVCEIVQMESFGQITRKGYVDGWSQAFYEHKVQPDTAAHAKYVRACIDKLPRDPAFFKQVYRRAFLAGKETGQKSMDKEIAMAYWDAIFVPGVKPWRTGRVDWLAAWKRYLEAEWKRGVNKDMWNQTLEFANKTLVDETLGFWSEEAAWPGVIDEFVVWCRANKIVPTPSKGNGSGNGDEMEFDS